MPNNPQQLINLTDNYPVALPQTKNSLNNQKLIALLQLIQQENAIIPCVDALLNYAIFNNASDIHCEPYQEHSRIRIRIDGMLQTITKCSTLFLSRLSARLKVMANLDISERRLPQDGQILVMLANDSHAFRIATLPINHGEKIVLRLLSPLNQLPQLIDLGLNPAQLERYQTALQQPQGLILVTGPTGSGKSTTLYSGLTTINNDKKNIITVEDPIEIPIIGINQTQINIKAGLNYLAMMRALLRQDPDVMMIGEIRDAVTAELALESALTGHLVLSSLHTKSCYETIFRLQQLALPHYLIAASLSLIISQRLVRLLCHHCKQPSKENKPLSAITYYDAKGCSACHEGYLGRTALYQFLNITPEIKLAILQQASLSDLKQLGALQQCEPLWSEALKLAAQGQTSLAEIRRVIDSDL